MAKVKVLVSKVEDLVTIVPFARDEISDRASGNSIHYDWNKFQKLGIEKIDALLRNYHSLDASIPSEFYQQLPEAERNWILENSVEFNVVFLKGREHAHVRVNDEKKVVNYPIDESLLDLIANETGKHRTNVF